MAASYQETIKEDSLTYSKMVQKVQKIKSENEKLNKLLNEKNERITQQTNFIISLRDSIQNIETKEDTVYIDNKPQLVRRFNIVQKPFLVVGWFQTKSPFKLNLDTLMAKMKLNVIITENRNSIFNSYVNVPYDNIIVEDINTKIVPYSPSFWEKLKFGIGFLGSGEEVNLFLQTGYQNVTVLTGYSNNGFVFGGTYWLK